VLIARNVERGTVVQAGKSLMTLAPSGDVQLVLQIDEKNIGLIALGQTAIVSADAYPDRLFEARSVEVKLTAAAPPDFIRQDMTVSVDIAIASRKDTLVLPTRAVHDLSSSPWVLKVENGRAARVPVKVGLRAAGKVEVLDAVAEGDAVVPATADLQPGAHVRVQAR
jgi:HlyD family secretion protein